MHIFLLFLVLFPISTFGFQQSTNELKKPNIIVVMTDDQGQWTLPSYGQKYIQTPNLDYIADHGVKFENAITPAPVCSAARASFHTGKMPSQHGVYDFLSEGKDFNNEWLKGETLLSQRLKQNGYQTALFGKWHASKASTTPVRGFDRWLSYDAINAGWKNQYNHSGSVLFSDDGKPYNHTGVQARFLTEKAIEFIDQTPQKPFFVNINYVEPHFPFAGLPERLVSKYRNVARKVVRDGGSSALGTLGPQTLVPENHEESLAQYFAAINLIDDQIGRLIDALEGRNLLNNTIIAFVSDHGLLMGQYGLYGKTNASFPYNFYEETIKIPFIFYGPSTLIKGKQVRTEFVDLLDLHNTILDFSGDKAHNKQVGPGRSIRNLLNGKRVKNWKRYQIAERGNARMITDGKWKLVRYFKKNTDIIDNWYDLTHPMKEQYIVAPPREEVKEKMITALEQFFSQYETEKSSGKNIWRQPPPNFNSKKLMEHVIWQ